MTRKFICVLAIIVLAICLLSGGCFSPGNDTVKAWKDLIKISPQKDTTQKANQEPELSIEKLLKSQTGSKDKVKGSVPKGATIQVELYFIGPDGKKLVAEKRTIPKVEGIARRTVEELIKGPQKAENLGVFPDGTKLLDINVKPDGLCVVDLNSRARQVDNQHQEEFMVHAIANTLGQFPTISGIDFMINGERVDSIGQFVDLSQPVEPDYSI
jgi:spore germination protein GerM